MPINLISFNYKHVPMEELEQLCCDKDGQTHYLSKLVPSIFFEEMVIVSTCNRIEWTFVCKNSEKAIDVLLNEIAEYSGLKKRRLKSMMTVVSGTEPVLRHLFELVSGLKSMVLGENEILGQIKDQYSFCYEFGATKSLLNKSFQMVIALGKDVRSKTGISKGAHSISSIAIEAIRRDFGTFLNYPLLFVGAGVMIQRALAKLTAMGHQQLWVSNRTMSKAEALAHNYEHLNVIPYADIYKELHRFATIYVAIHSHEFLFQPGHFEHLDDHKCVVDLGVPRNVDPMCARLLNVSIISIGQLDHIATSTIDGRRNEIQSVEVLIDETLSEFKRWQSFRQSEEDGWSASHLFG